jgi:quinone-modifying oxidoreductase subunit QmoC
MVDLVRLEPDPSFVGALMRSGGETARRCYQCATCSTVCTLSPDDRPFPRRQMLWAQRGIGERLVGDPDVWLCHHCGDCTARCPRGARPGEVLGAIRAATVAQLAFPRALADALNDPKTLPALLAAPALVLGLLMWASGTLQIHPGPIVFANLLPHNAVFEGLFMALAFWSAVAGAVGVSKQWAHMKRVCPAAPGASTTPIGASLLEASRQIVVHERFRACEKNNARWIAHALVLAGFVCAMIAAGGGAVLEKAFHHAPPIPSSHPVKLVGDLGALGLLAGAAILVHRRVNRKDEVGESSSFDWTFLGVLAAVGLTGTISYLVRLAGSAALAYPIYFVHLSLVFFLLGTLPYTKFAHLVYRTAAMTYAIHVGRRTGAGETPVP